MVYDIAQQHRARQPNVAIRSTVAPASIGPAMGQLLGDLFGSFGARGMAAAGPPWARYLALGPGEVEFEVAAPVTGEGRVMGGLLLACDVVSTVHVGSYEGLVGAYEAIGACLREHGALPSGALWEACLTDPERQPDPAGWRTLIVCPYATGS